MNAYNHLAKTNTLMGYAEFKKVSGPRFMIIFSGLLLFVGGLGILFGVYVQISTVALIVFLLAVSFKMHAFWTISEPNARMTDMINFTKNMALLGALLMILGIPMPWAYSL